MSNFPVGVAAPDGAQKLVDVCKGTWAVIQDESSDINTNNKAVESFEVAMNELNEMGVHVNNEGGFPVFTSGVKETAYDPSALVAGAHRIGADFRRPPDILTAFNTEPLFKTLAVGATYPF
jgi:hypothetical protein